MHPLIPSQNLFVSLLADTRISLTIISFGKSITIMINIRRIMCLWLIKNVEQGKKFPVPTRNRTSDLHILLQCFSTETQRLNGELGLLCDLITTHHQAQSFFFLFFIFLTRFIIVIGSRKYFYMVTVFFTMLVSGEGLVNPPPPPPQWITNAPLFQLLRLPEFRSTGNKWWKCERKPTECLLSVSNKFWDRRLRAVRCWLTCP